MFALFRFPFSLSVHLYIFKVTDGSSRHPHFAACIPDCFRRLFLVLHLVCLSKVYQRSLFFSASVLSESGCKGNCFFSFCQTFRKFFFEKVFFRETEGRLSRSLGQYQGKILAQSEAGSSTEFFSMSFQLPEPSLPKAVAKV